MTFTFQKHWLPQLDHIARRAGEAIMQIYRGDIHVQRKADESPVTQADVLAEEIILEGLAALAPEIPVVAEEAVAAGRVPDVSKARSFWLVDPLDGTREFVNRNGEFTVNIAFIEDGEPVAGVVFAPAIGRAFCGWVGEGASVHDAAGERSIRCRPAPPRGLTVLASRSHGDKAALAAFLADLPVHTTMEAGSSLKLCLLAEGRADLYPRFGRTMEWDIAAGQAVLAAAGGSVRTMSGAALRYGKPGFENPDFVARGLPG
ncbi:3'(2'),5'-bisphosphate nucleotidase CysQ [Piscinibacter terrae]|uniref:3'(2'),5'-bisphosphate nucleotidase CysQ n=1 Tax=Piscinibacter terrae TaxID=2496871 RepID=A0A3N7HMZ0_9BURK|nr:3'(2'),5'-bisphosphate nucleotidase CysQ [Albitalea terrae]RQP23494.1 3'(2'),5'-bisphosphate nucleotidase [Albitalea terrae]